MGLQLVQLGVRSERRVLRPDNFEGHPKLDESRLVEAAAHPSRVLQLSIVVVAQEQRAKGVRAGSRPGRIATHDKLLRQGRLHLEPRVAAGAGVVDAAPSFGHHPLQTQLDGRLEKALPVSLHVLDRLDGLARHKHASQQPLPLQQGHSVQAGAVQVEEIEGVVPGLDLDIRRDGAAPLREPGAGLEEPEVWQPGLIERHHLPVQHQLIFRLAPQLGHDPGKTARNIDAGPAAQRYVASFDERQSAMAVQLRLEEPVPVGEWLIHQPRQHRLHLGREGRLPSQPC